MKKPKKPPKESAWTPFGKYPEGTEITYVFAAVDDRYGIFNLSLRSKRRIPHRELKEYMKEAKAEIDRRGSPGLDLWARRMLGRGFRMIPSTVIVLDDTGMLPVDCVPPVEECRRTAGGRS